MSKNLDVTLDLFIKFSFPCQILCISFHLYMLHFITENKYLIKLNIFISVYYLNFYKYFM